MLKWVFGGGPLFRAPLATSEKFCNEACASQTWDVRGAPAKGSHSAQTFLFPRLRRLWEEEVSRSGTKNASLLRVLLRFQRTRVLCYVTLTICLSVMSVIGPVSGRLGAVWGAPGLRDPHASTSLRPESGTRLSLRCCPKREDLGWGCVVDI